MFHPFANCYFVDSSGGVSLSVFMNSINTEKGEKKTTERKNVSTQLSWCHQNVTQLYNLTGKGDINSQRRVHANTHEISENARDILDLVFN